jgi:DNA-binding response OmpR family regulator
MKILVIEDDSLIAQALMTILTSHNYAVEVAVNGPDGLVLLNSFEYDLLILDIELPTIDGYRFASRSEPVVKTPKNPKVLISRFCY